MASRRPKRLEKTLLRLRVFLQTWDEDAHQLKESIGHVKLLEHKETAAVHLLVLEYNSLKVLANHPITASTGILEHPTVESACFWNCKYFADGELKEETFFAQFSSTDNSRKFRETMEKIARSAANKEGALGDVDLAAESLEKLAAKMTSFEEILIHLKTILYTFDEDGIEWMCKGRGHVMLLEHSKSAKHRLLMLEYKTLKVLANHPITSSMRVVKHLTIDEACLWIANDSADGEVEEKKFCAKFSVGNSRKFREVVKVARSAGKQEGASGEQMGSSAGAGMVRFAIAKGKEKAGVIE